MPSGSTAFPLDWRKSSYSSSEGGDCVEVALAWRKSSHSTNEGGNCVEVADCPSAVHVRDSKNPGGPSLALPPAAWAAFLTGGRRTTRWHRA
ncbi:DUF397 domain-containing protein [Streptomyces calidiresistens]|uniref:DUF397 domain-containing protein n=1 Tax=Streptomyces calidiresistens TaxID=1485586 RepID=A0A7W3T3P1_9ACTN|nr:DUF397 domain-containing protein [Streptomyces calidiresistens]MBB0230337.1 DUF397 domain-containing protein [Streptomyces calidiresistens]